jgi:long-chain fatty acid transport protein
LYAAFPVSERLSLGLSLNSPFNMKSKWQNDWEGQSINQEISLQTYYVQPTASFKVSNNFSLGAGLVYAYSDLAVRRQIGEFNGNAEYTGTASGFGYNVGIYGKVQEELAFGITYKSSVNFNYDNGNAVFSNIPASLSAQYQNQNFDSEITLPSTLSVGLSNRVTDKVLLAFEFNLTGWATYDSLNFNFENAATTDSRTPRKFEDAMAFRVGLEYAPTEKLEVRGGVYFDETPVRDEYISPDFPDGNRLGFTTGLSYKLTERFEVDGAFMFEKVTDRIAKANETKVDISSISGTYRTLVTGVGVGLSYKF